MDEQQYEQENREMTRIFVPALKNAMIGDFAGGVAGVVENIMKTTIETILEYDDPIQAMKDWLMHHGQAMDEAHR
jgi:hypothetical protein